MNLISASYIFTLFLTVEVFLVFTKMFHLNSNLNCNWREPEKVEPKEFSGFMSPFPLLIIPFLSKENKGKGWSNFAVVYPFANLVFEGRMSLVGTTVHKAQF